MKMSSQLKIIPEDYFFNLRKRHKLTLFIYHEQRGNRLLF